MRTTKLRVPAEVLCALSLLGAAGAWSAAGCSATAGTNGFADGGGGPGATSGAGGEGGDLGLSTGSGSSGTGVLVTEPSCEGKDPNLDNDGDGWTGAAGDCNDCTPQMNPGALDWPGNDIDEDCNGKNDDTPMGCDASLSVSSASAIDGAKAMGLCKIQQGESWGMVKAEYVTADGQPLQNYDPQGLGHGILNGFGPNVHPQEGNKMLALSSGTARQPTDPGYQSVAGYDKGYPNPFGGPQTGPPPGFPKESTTCSATFSGEAHDSAAMKVTLRTPTNAKSLHFNLNFYTYEFPVYVCSEYNDFFVALFSPPPAAAPDGNISFDSQGNLISVNAGFLEVCHPQPAGGKNFPCALGFTQLAGTGFDIDYFGGPTTNSAATGWLQTTSAVATPGAEIELLFAIWDAGDGVLDSTILLDNFGFDVNDLGTSTDPVGTPK